MCKGWGIVDKVYGEVNVGCMICRRDECGWVGRM